MNDKKNKSWFNYVILSVVLIIPFIYSFFYLKAYWNPYGEGNLDNLPVAIVNEDVGTKGDILVNTLKDKNALKLEVVNTDEANDGLYDKTYYAVITIPKDFSSSMESAGSKEKKHPTITYSPNQKSNYLASQIIDKIILNVELSLDNQINAEIDGNLTDKLYQVPESLDTISSGLEKLENGTKELASGSATLDKGLDTLNNKYVTYTKSFSAVLKGNDTLYKSFKDLNDGINTLADSTKNLSDITSKASELVSGVEKLATNNNNLNIGLNNYVTSVNGTLDFSKSAALAIKQIYEQSGKTDDQLYKTAVYLLNTNSFDTLKTSGSYIAKNSDAINTNIGALNKNVQTFGQSLTDISKLGSAVTKLQDGSNKMFTGMSTINSGLTELNKANTQISSGLKELNNGSSKISSGANTLNSSVASAKSELDKNIKETKDELKLLDDLKDYSENPVVVDTQEVNKVSSYGTAFSPFFISIALWVGALMLYIVLYYDKEERFAKLSINNENHLQRTLCYHGLATLSGIILGILLNLFLDFEITNYFLYYISLVLVANTFVAIMEFLIVNFKDIGKFIALILLVLQLAAAGGTFPIETVTHGFRFLHNFLPMTYTINLFKECLVSIETSILTKNLVVVICILVVFMLINIIRDIISDKENK